MTLPRARLAASSATRSTATVSGEASQLAENVKSGIAWSVEQARTVASELGFPLVVRPSYVLGGRAMQIIHDETQLQY